MSDITLLGFGLLVTVSLLGLLKLWQFKRAHLWVHRDYLISLERALETLLLRVEELEQAPGMEPDGQLYFAPPDKPKTTKLLYRIVNPNTGQAEEWYQVFQPGEYEKWKKGLRLVQRGSRELWVREGELRPSDQEIEPFTWERRAS